ncbi:MAG TPA: methyltransferase [Rhodospirillaceae bacterium]|nr:methyltransferase [Rhodospirillaceae bacterium]
MSEIAGIIRNLIAADGPISVARFMQLALSYPKHGYYMKGDPLGVSGDFTTAPEISQMFGELIGLWLADMWRQMGQPLRFTLLELGAGRGTLLADALRASEKVPGFHAAMKLKLIESNETLKALQREKLAAYKPDYIADLSALPEHPVFFIANEFFDVLPVHQYVKLADGWRERMVGLSDDKFVFVTGEAAVPLPLPDGAAFYEISPMAIAMVSDIAAHIAAYGGAALFIDYGYSEAKGCSTLQAVSGHEPVNALERPGQVDLTAHVDFASLKLAAQKHNVAVSPIIGQGAFLKALGIELRARQLKMQGNLEQADAIDAALHRLTDPSEMGALFKVMAMAPKDCKDIAGFP